MPQELQQLTDDTRQVLTTSQADDNTSLTVPAQYQRLIGYRDDINTMLEDSGGQQSYDKWEQAVQDGDFDAIAIVIQQLELEKGPAVRKVKTKLVEELDTMAKHAEAIADHAAKIKDGLWNKNDLDDMKIAWMTQAWKPKTKTLLSRSGTMAKECSTPCPQCSESPSLWRASSRMPSSRRIRTWE